LYYPQDAISLLSSIGHTSTRGTDGNEDWVRQRQFLICYLSRAAAEGSTLNVTRDGMCGGEDISRKRCKCFPE
jgi:hypothetical protein